GLVAAFVAVAAGEMTGMALFPLPKGVDVSTPEAIAKAMDLVPAGAKVAVVLAWALGAFAGPWVAAKVAPGGKVTHGMVVGGLFLLATLGNLRMIPHPAWMWVVGLAEVLPAAYLGARLAAGRPAAITPEPVSGPV